LVLAVVFITLGEEVVTRPVLGRQRLGHVVPANVRRMPTHASGSRPERFMRATFHTVIRGARTPQCPCMPSVTHDGKTPNRAASGRAGAEARLPGMRLRPLERYARDALRGHGRSPQNRSSVSDVRSTDANVVVDVTGRRSRR